MEEEERVQERRQKDERLRRGRKGRGTKMEKEYGLESCIQSKEKWRKES